jgi:hypothetical protein
MHMPKRIVFSSLVSPSEAAKILGIHPITLLTWRRRGWLVPDLRIPGGTVAYARPTLARFMANGGAEPFRAKPGAKLGSKHRIKEVTALTRPNVGISYDLRQSRASLWEVIYSQ